MFIKTTDRKRILFLAQGFSEKDADRTVQDLFELNKREGAIFLQINSAGGSFPGARKLYDNISASPNAVIGVVLGDCFSGATIVLQACTKRLASINSRIHIHHAFNPATITFRHFDTLSSVSARVQKEIDLVKSNDKIIIDILTISTGMEMSQIVKILDKNEILSPEQALKMKLIDEII
jgi:ATP-dependent protease ClpP protease subunit